MLKKKKKMGNRTGPRKWRRLVQRLYIFSVRAFIPRARAFNVHVYITGRNNTFIFIARNTREVKNNILKSSGGSPVLLGDRRARRGVFGGRKKGRKSIKNITPSE
jgi:hypothetical protein